ncbi:MAG: translation elongation factor-like protein [Nanoarchaeota archaeon]|nr:translation elongation factor-like protein [Nanoarchaeota archaeon]
MVEKHIGVVSNYFSKVGVVAIKLEGKLKLGDKIRITGGDVKLEQPVEEMQINLKSVKEAKKGDDVGVKINGKVRKGYNVFKI